MKKIVILLSVVFIFSLLIGCSSKSNTYPTSEAEYKAEYLERLKRDPLLLAQFLCTFDDTGEHTNQQAVADMRDSFLDNKELYNEAIKKAESYIAEMHIDCDWESLKDLDRKLEDIPRAINAETGEPISSKLGVKWDGPSDRLSQSITNQGKCPDFSFLKYIKQGSVRFLHHQITSKSISFVRENNRGVFHNM